VTGVRARRTALLALAAAVTVAAAWWLVAPATPPTSRAPTIPAPTIPAPTIPAPTIPSPAAAIDPASNVTRADYVGPEACARCHADNAAGWRRGLHATMNQRATPAAIVGDFDGATLAYGGGAARFERDGRDARMVLTDRAGTTRRYRVTRTIGSRGLQEYVGVDEAAATPVELRLPFGWWRARPGWYPQPYYDSWFPAEYAGGSATPVFDPFVPDPSPWAARCPWCHNTYPFATRLARADVGHGPERYLAPVAPAITDNRLPVDDLVTVGISCESCHLGGRAHAAEPERVAPSFVPVGAEVRWRADAPRLPAPGDRDDPRVLNTLCAQCHSAPTPRYPDGSAARNSSEALDLAAGGCAGAIRCVDCHDPHQRGAEPGGPDRAAPVAACTRCHAELATAAAAAAHGRHAASVTCLDCHLPRIVQGIGAVVRSHRVSSPGDPAMLAAGAPNACNLCHLDRSIRWTVAALARWGVVATIAPSWRRAYGGDLDFAVGPTWLTSREPFVRLVAAAAYARAGDRRALPALLEALDDPQANPRMWILFAIEDLLDRRLSRGEYDPLAPPATRRRQLARLRAWAARQRERG